MGYRDTNFSLILVVEWKLVSSPFDISPRAAGACSSRSPRPFIQATFLPTLDYNEVSSGIVFIPFFKVVHSDRQLY